MAIKRREFINLTTKATIATGMFATLAACKNNEQPSEEAPKETELKNMVNDIAPISTEERQQRVAKAQKLMNEQGIEALIIDSGTTLDYFTGIHWWPSERTMVAIIPSNGDVFYICPGFEEDRLRENVTIGNDILVWQEDESPFKLIVSSLNNKGITSGNIALENYVRFFVMDGIRKEGPDFNYVTDTITKVCRLIKSPNEIALMQRAFDITAEAIKTGISQLKEGMSQGELSAIISKAHSDMGVSGGGLVLFGVSSSFPHGSKVPQTLKNGDVVLMDCGCNVHGYSSDITRTIIFGEPNDKQLKIWNLEKKSQDAGFAAAQIGATCGSVDAASRKVITDAGFGPDYKLPGLPHRTGHGIGMDGHEWGYIVKGNDQKLEPGMCFSIEPTIALPGEFGIRLEDCVYMTENGPKWFVQPSPSISQPFV